MTAKRYHGTNPNGVNMIPISGIEVSPITNNSDTTANPTNRPICLPINMINRIVMTIPIPENIIQVIPNTPIVTTPNHISMINANMVPTTVNIAN